ncbi:MAG: transposase, partial [Saprospiraceae bacterium]|nr:transposase [Saprospiraceae bacterium]
QFSKMLSDLQESTINTEGIFMNADAGFDSKAFRNQRKAHEIIPNIDFNKRNSKNTDDRDLLDDKLYKERFSVERTNAWIDAFKTLLVRFETTVRNWQSFHYIAFCIILIRSKTNHF